MKNRNVKYWLRTGSYSFLQNFANLIFGFGSFLLLIRFLDKNEFGTWALFLSITVLIDMGRNGLIQNAFIKFAVDAKDVLYKKIFTGSLELNFIVSVISSAVIYLSSFLIADLFNAPQMESLLKIYSVTILLLLVYSQCLFVLQKDNRFKKIFYSVLIRQFVFFSLVLFLIYNNELSLLNLAAAHFIAASISTVTITFFAIKEFSFQFTIEIKWIKKLFNYGKYVFGTAVSSIILNNTDAIMLGHYLGTGAVALYNTAFKVVNIIEVPIASIANVVFPKSARLANKNNKTSVKELYEKSVGIILSLIIPVMIIIFFFSEDIIKLIAGTDYLNSVPVLEIIIIYTAIKPFLRIFGTTLDSIGKPKTNFAIILLLVVLNAISNYIFINIYGLNGAALGTLTSLVIGFVLINRILKTELGIRFFNSIKYVFFLYSTLLKTALKLIKTKPVILSSELKMRYNKNEK